VVIHGASSQAIVGLDTRAFVFKEGMLAGALFGAKITSWYYRHLVGVRTHPPSDDRRVARPPGVGILAKMAVWASCRSW
jgi:hypothetical protein